VEPSISAPLLCFLLACAAFMVWLSAVKLLTFDEMLSFYTESAPTAAGVLSFQRLSPVSLDPPLYHLLGHWALAAGLAPAFAVRLPSLLGSFLMIACVYVFTRRLAGRDTAAFSVVGLILFNMFHLVEARPYGLMLGASALALLLWQNVLRERSRTASLAGLFCVLGVAVSSHYFGILVMVPFLIAECFRTVRRRKLDVGLLAVLLGSCVFALGWLPYLKGAHQYKNNYYIKVNAADFARAYTAPVRSILSHHSVAWEWLACMSVVLVVITGAWLGYKSSNSSESRPTEWIAVLAFALLPIFGVLLARVASGAFESRYVIGFILGIAIALSAGLMALVRSQRWRSVLLAGFCLMTAVVLLRMVKINNAAFAELTQNARLLDAQGVNLITDKSEFLWLHHYMPDAPGVQNAVWVADIPREIAATGSDNIDRTMLNLQAIGKLPVISYENLQRDRSFRMIEDQDTVPLDWIEGQLQRDGARILATGHSASDTSYQVQLPPR
jgi:4-amino-4-deoxy-L-arabinose transferase-like glycosyltransferase